MKRDPLIFVITAASATGKSSCAKRLCEQDDRLVLTISHSTRPIRPGERDGVDKYFITPDQFDALQAEQAFVEQTEIFGHRCGHTRAALESQAGVMNDLVMILDYRGLCQIKKQFKETVSIFLLPPEMGALRTRIDQRPEACGVNIEQRMQSARREMQDYAFYDYIVVNDSLDQAVIELQAIVQAERLRTQRQVRNDWKILQELA